MLVPRWQGAVQVQALRTLSCPHMARVCFAECVNLSSLKHDPAISSSVCLWQPWRPCRLSQSCLIGCLSAMCRRSALPLVCQLSVCSFVSLKFTCYVCFVRPRHSREHTAGLLSAIVEAYGFSPTQVVCCGCPGLSAEVALVRYSEGSEQMVHTHLCGS